MTGAQKSVRVVWCPSGSMSPFEWFLRPLRGPTTVLPSAGSVGLRPTARPTLGELSFGFVIAPKTQELNPDSHTQTRPLFDRAAPRSPRFPSAPVSTPDQPNYPSQQPRPQNARPGPQRAFPCAANSPARLPRVCEFFREHVSELVGWLASLLAQARSPIELTDCWPTHFRDQISCPEPKHRKP